MRLATGKISIPPKKKQDGKPVRYSGDRCYGSRDQPHDSRDHGAGAAAQKRSARFELGRFDVQGDRPNQLPETGQQEGAALVIMLPLESMADPSCHCPAMTISPFRRELDQPRPSLQLHQQP